METILYKMQQVGSYLSLSDHTAEDYSACLLVCENNKTPISMFLILETWKRRVCTVRQIQPSPPPFWTGLCCSTGCRLSYYSPLTTVETVFLALMPRLPNQQIKEKKLKWTHCKTPNFQFLKTENPLLKVLHGVPMLLWKGSRCQVVWCSLKLPWSLLTEI